MTQKELKAMYTEELAKAWNDPKMITHCIKHADYIIEHDGGLYAIDKPSIKTRFCFPYGMNGTSADGEEEKADQMALHAKKSTEYFIAENLAEINHWIKKLKKILDDMSLNWAEGSQPRYMIETGAHYYGQTEDCKLRYYSIVDTYSEMNRGEICNNTELIKKLITGYEAVKENFIKRLNKYLSRYGLTKVQTWSFLSD